MGSFLPWAYFDVKAYYDLIIAKKGLFGLCYAMDGGYKGWNPYIERHLAIVFYLERTNQLSLLPDKDLVDLCPLSNHNK
jgi:hypothetical protein